MVRRIAQLMEFVRSTLGRAMLFFLTAACFFVLAPSAFANCSPPPGGSHAVTFNCSFSGSVDGVDAGNLTINSGVTLTINANQTIIFNPGTSVAVNGVIAVSASGAQMRQTYLWMTDADIDGYPDSASQYAQDGQPGNGRRRSQLTSYSIVDCNSTNSSLNINRAGYLDSDSDGYPGTYVNGCYAAAQLSGSATDCNDSDINLRTYGYGVDGDSDTYGQSGYGCNNGAGNRTATAGTDCNDNYWCVKISTGGAFPVDADQDGYDAGYAATPSCKGTDATINGRTYTTIDNAQQGSCTYPYLVSASLGTDCNDGSNAVWYTGYVDGDGDGVTGSGTACNNNPGSSGGDCNDSNVNAYTYGYGFDNDRDGYGVNEYGCNNGNIPYDGWLGYDPDDSCTVVPDPYVQCQ